jgi:bifunctional N-acetylglucosamine-1-phosphate-uridyltransferase/glucosamine-1-phosphate-acetyltransferase GlmU-like protein
MAGGSGTRMNSTVPKQLMNVGNGPMTNHLIDNAHLLGSEIVLIVSTKNKSIIIDTLEKDFIKKLSDEVYCYKGTIINICVQEVANGTAGALMATTKFFSDKARESSLLILSAVVPLIAKKIIINMFNNLEKRGTYGIILARVTDQNFGYGRIVTENDDGNQHFVKVVEQKDCNDNSYQHRYIRIQDR